jgi:hypothetical protein
MLESFDDAPARVHVQPIGWQVERTRDIASV